MQFNQALSRSQQPVLHSKPDVERENFLVSLVNIVDDSDDVACVTDINLRFQLLLLLQNYAPQKSKDIYVQMKILLTDEIPVCSTPR